MALVALSVDAGDVLERGGGAGVHLADPVAGATVGVGEKPVAGVGEVAGLGIRLSRALAVVVEAMVGIRVTKVSVVPGGVALE